MDNEKRNHIIEETIKFVKETLKGAESGHDWYHIERVWSVARRIAEKELENNKELKNFDPLVVELGALLHDIADHKFHNGDDKIGAKVAKDFLKGLNLDEEIIDKVSNVILKISFKGSTEKNEMDTLEGQIVQDSDRLDAIGAMGVARAFSFGGFRKREMYDPDQKPNLNMTWEEYKNNKGTTVNHFYEKLLLIKDRMNTDTGKKMAQKRHDYMLQFLDQFFNEWNSTDVLDV